MSLLITVNKVVKKDEAVDKEEYLIVKDEFRDSIKVPEWAKQFETTKTENELDWEALAEQKGIDFIDSEILPNENDPDTVFLKDTTSNKEHLIRLCEVPIKKTKAIVIYDQEVSFLNGSFNEQLSQDFMEGKIPEVIWKLRSLRSIKRKYCTELEDKDNFQKYIIDKFVEGECYVSVSC